MIRATRARAHSPHNKGDFALFKRSLSATLTASRAFREAEGMNAVFLKSVGIVVSALLVIIGGVLMLPGAVHGAPTSIGPVLLIVGFWMVGFTSLYLRDGSR